MNYNTVSNEINEHPDPYTSTIAITMFMQSPFVYQSFDQVIIKFQHCDVAKISSTDLRHHKEGY